MASTTPASNDPNAIYSLGHNPSESGRLQRQADELFPQSTALVDRTALGPGGTSIDVGCGPRGILDLLASASGRTAASSASTRTPTTLRWRHRWLLTATSTG